jgi:hypothetical protein
VGVLWSYPQGVQVYLMIGDQRGNDGRFLLKERVLGSYSEKTTVESFTNQMPPRPLLVPPHA